MMLAAKWEREAAARRAPQTYLHKTRAVKNWKLEGAVAIQSSTDCT